MSYRRRNYALIEACKEGDFDNVVYLLTSPELKEKASVRYEEYGCFREACEHGHLDIVKYLLESPDVKYRVDIHARDDWGFRYACRNGHIDIVEYLLTSPELKEYADVTAKDNCGFRWACENQHEDVYLFIMQHDNFLSENLEYCLSELDKQIILEVIPTLTQEQQNHFYKNNKEFFDNNFEELFTMYLENDTPLPDGYNEKHEEIDLIV